jgi:predicted aspartyl protease
VCRVRKFAVALLGSLLAAQALAHVPTTADRDRNLMNAMNDVRASVAIEPDASGRLRAPVFIEGKGPFSLIVDTGANGSAVSAAVAETLGERSRQSPDVLLRGVTGSSRVAAIRVRSLSIGGLVAPAATLAIVADALDGADGFLGMGAFSDKRVLLDFARGEIVFSASHSSSAGAGFVRVAADLSRSRLTIIDMRVNGRLIKAIIDTGAGGTIGNSAMRKLLLGTPGATAHGDRIIGTTSEVGYGQTFAMPAITIGGLTILGARASFADISLFDHLNLTRVPALLIGMDVLGQLDSMAIDYGARELQLRARSPEGANTAAR